MAFEPVHLSYELGRRQLLATHLRTWLHDWPGLSLMVAVTLIAVTLALLKSPWFLVILLVPPMLNNLPRFVAGLVNPLLWGALRMDVVIEVDRIGYRIGGERQWLALADVAGVERIGDVWSVLGEGVAIDIPVAAVDEATMAHVCATRGRRP